jgi:hypothetical protein
VSDGIAADFEQITAKELRFLVDEYDFQLVESDKQHVRLESNKLWAEIWFDSRGEIALTPQRIGSDKGYGKVEC